jgi:hypothetical protein
MRMSRFEGIKGALMGGGETGVLEVKPFQTGRFSRKSSQSVSFWDFLS